MQKTSKRVLAVFLALIMTLSIFTVSASALVENYNADYQSETHTVFRHSEQTLAPGVTYYNNYAYSSDGKQMVYYVATANINRDDVLVQGSYLNASIDNLGMSKLTEQVAAANAKFSDPDNAEFISENYTVVAGTNGDFYNMTTGQPSGAFAINGRVMNESNNRPWFAVFEDGTAACGANKADYDAAVAEYGAVRNAVGGSQMLVVDGADVTASASGSYNTDRHSRTMIGVTADNKVVCAVLDGRQEPFSCGGTMHELAQIMLEAGCVVAINLDGGGSTTFGARPEGEDSFRVLNRPSDGSERSISSGVVIASLAAPSDVFSRASITPADEYVTPGTSTALAVTGVSPAGTSAEIPAEVTYEATLGSVVDGYFVSDGTVGDAVISAIYNDEVVGTATVHVVIPDTVDITSDSVTVPYGKSTELPIVLKHGFNEVAFKSSDLTITLEDPAAGTVDGLVFTAAGESEIVSTVITVALNGTDLSDTAALLFGKGSDVIFDFEDGTTNGFGLNYSNYNYYLPKSSVFVATEENGKVHSGKYALGLNIDYSNSQESGYQMIALYQGKVNGNVNYYEDAVNMGAWLYIPDEYVGLWVRWVISPINSVAEDPETGEKTYTLASITPQTMDRTAGGTGVVYSFDESGWHYLSADLSSYKGLAWRDFYYCMQFYISDRDGASYGYYAKNNHNINGNFTVYLDDVTVDYSTVVEDRDAPVFQSVLLGDRGPHSNEALVLTDGYDSDGYNQLSFSARVADYDAANATGLDADSAKVYVDGNDVGCTCQNGLISAGEEVTLNEGKHSVKFVICDNAGNRSSATRTFTVSNVSREEFIKVVPHDPSLNRILHGSLYWVDVVTTDAASTSKVITTLNLDSMSTWELDHMVPADGFTASYEVVDAGDKIVKITVEPEGEVTAVGELALVSIPIRTCEMDNMTKRNALSEKKWNYAEYKASKEYWPEALEVRVVQGLAYFKGSHRYFTGEDVFCWTESFANYANMQAQDADYQAAWNGGHDHRPAYADYYAEGTTNYHEPIVSKEAKKPSCTEDGWTAELYCDECNSVVQWSESIPATGHTYDFEQKKIYFKISNNGSDASPELAYNGGIGYYVQSENYVNTYVAFETDNTTNVITFTNPNWFGTPYLYYWYDDHTTDCAAWPGIAMTSIGNNSYGQAQYTFEMPDAPEVLACADCGELFNGVYDVDGKLYKDGALFSGFDGGKYYIDGEAQAYTGIVEIDGFYYEFDENNATTGKYTGFITDGDDLMYSALGVLKTGWVDVDDEYYYFGEDFKAVDGKQRIDHYSYEFVDKKLYNGQWLTTSDGHLVYKWAGTLLCNRWFTLRDKTYHFDHRCYAATGEMLVKLGTGGASKMYVFDDEGVLQSEVTSTGLYTVGDTSYYLSDGIAQIGLFEVDGDYYYFNSSYVMVKDAKHYIDANAAHGIVSEGYCWFGEDGKLLNNVFADVDGSGMKYYVMGRPGSPDGGWIESDGKTYYVKSDGTLAKVAAWVDNVYYYFDAADGHLLDHEFAEYGDTLYYFIGGLIQKTGLTVIGEDTYYISTSSGRVIRDCGYWVAGNHDPSGVDQFYMFDKEGKMYNNDFYEVGDATYYFVNGKPVKAGLFEVEGSLYYASTNSGEIKKGKYYVTAANSGEYPGNRYYHFDTETGAALDHVFFTENDKKYYMINGLPYANGVTEIDGDIYYLSTNDGAVKTGQYFVLAANSNGILSQGWYDFGDDGRLIILK